MTPSNEKKKRGRKKKVVTNPKDDWVDLFATVDDDKMVDPDSWGKLDYKTAPDNEVFSTGAIRQPNKGRGRYDLISTIALSRLARILELGVEKYGERNWEKGIKLSRYINSAMRHICQLIEGKKDEDHAAAVLFNIMAYIHTETMIDEGKLPSELKS